jgi:DNA-binding protein H-NS
MKEADVIAAVAKSKAAANRAAKTLSPAQLESAAANLKAAAAAAKAREASKADKRRAANIKKLSAMMAEMGLSASDIAGGGAGKRGRKKAPAVKTKAKAKSKRGARKGTKVAPKYQISAGGKNHKWTGRGRMPVVFREFVEKGGSLEQCKI